MVHAVARRAFTLAAVTKFHFRVGTGIDAANDALVSDRKFFSVSSMLDLVLKSPLGSSQPGCDVPSEKEQEVGDSGEHEQAP